MPLNYANHVCTFSCQNADPNKSYPMPYASFIDPWHSTHDPVTHKPATHDQLTNYPATNDPETHDTATHEPAT